MIFKIIQFLVNRDKLSDEFETLTRTIDKLHKIFDNLEPWFYDGWGFYPDEKTLHRSELELKILATVFRNEYLIWKMAQ